MKITVVGAAAIVAIVIAVALLVKYSSGRQDNSGPER
jgi:hypothetical protein